MRYSFLALLTCMLTATLARAEAPALWLYYSTNLQVDANVEKLEAVWRRAAAAGYSHVMLADSKMARLGDLQGSEGRYFANVDRVKKLAKQLGLEIVPCVFHVGYSNNMLWHDANLAEGLAVRDALFVVKNNQAVLKGDPAVSISGKWAWKDDNVTVADGVATVEDTTGNARISWKLNCAPARAYRVSVKVKTKDFHGDARIAAIAEGQSLQYQNPGLKPTQDWTQVRVVFNSLDHQQINVYLGVWGGAKGRLQWKDWQIEEIGPINILRRPGTPVTIKGLVEGKDYEPVVDPHLGNKPWPGEYDWDHDAPAIRTKGVADGTELRISWYHPAIIYDGQVTICPSEEKTYDLLVDEAKRVQKAFETKTFMMSHDEIRTWNQCAGCRDRHLSAGQLLAENVKRCQAMLAGEEVLVWSDMFDPHHNAVGDYYLVNGDLAGSWEGLEKRTIIVNWNHGKRDESLAFFAGRGHRQIIAGYYDGPVKQIDDWLASAKKVEGVVGVMYTTWQNKYDDLEAFALRVRR